ncbi:MAG: hypothetical protein JNK10_02335 [Cyclobacteriaceae bacterium]|nr:hypothetical protein [Cyclobacteriaceae bacterium]
MRAYIVAIAALLIFGGCGKSTTDHDHDGSTADSTDANRILYDQVMDIHDQVMPKMQDIYNLKKKLQDQIAATPNMVVEERQKLERRIAALDSADKMMMEWMHKFSPLPDSAGREAAREYLESEMESIKKVRDAMLEAIQREQGSN